MCVCVSECVFLLSTSLVLWCGCSFLMGSFLGGVWVCICVKESEESLSLNFRVFLCNNLYFCVCGCVWVCKFCSFVLQKMLAKWNMFIPDIYTVCSGVSVALFRILAVQNDDRMLECENLRSFFLTRFGELLNFLAINKVT